MPSFKEQKSPALVKIDKASSSKQIGETNDDSGELDLNGWRAKMIADMAPRAAT